MIPVLVNEAAPVPPPAYHRMQARLGPALHIDALTDASPRCICSRCAVWQYATAHRRCSPPLPAGPGGAPRTYSEESLLLIALLRTLWRLSYQDMRDWLRDWSALALACGLRAFAKTAAPAFLARPSNANAGRVQGPRCRKRSSSSASWPPSAVG
jgi:hypothetical protein